MCVIWKVCFSEKILFIFIFDLFLTCSKEIIIGIMIKNYFLNVPGFWYWL